MSLSGYNIVYSNYILLRLAKATFWLIALFCLSACQLITGYDNSAEVPDFTEDATAGNSLSLAQLRTAWDRHIGANDLAWQTRSDSPVQLIEKLTNGLFFSLDTAGNSSLVDINSNKSVALCNFKAGFNSATFEKQSGLLALAYPAEVIIYQQTDCQQKYRITRIATRIAAMQFHPSADSLILAGIDSRVYRWRFTYDDPELGVKQQALALERYFGHPTPVTSLALHYDGRIFFSGDNNGLVFAWRYFDSDRYSGEFDNNKQFGLRGHSERAVRSAFRLQSQSGIQQLRISPDGRYLIIGSQTGFIEIRKVRGFKLLTSFEAHQGLIYDLIFLDGQPLSFASTSRDNLLKVWTAIPEINKTGTYKANMLLQQHIEDLRLLTVIDRNSLLAVSSTGNLQQIRTIN